MLCFHFQLDEWNWDNVLNSLTCQTTFLDAGSSLRSTVSQSAPKVTENLKMHLLVCLTDQSNTQFNQLPGSVQSRQIDLMPFLAGESLLI